MANLFSLFEFMSIILNILLCVVCVVCCVCVCVCVCVCACACACACTCACACGCVCVCVTAPGKTGLIYTKYTFFYYSTYLLFCMCYPKSVSFIEFPLDMIGTSLLCFYFQLLCYAAVLLKFICYAQY